MIDVRTAVKKAVEFAQELPLLEGAKSPTLEEVELVGKTWQVTLGFHNPKKMTTAFEALRGPLADISYKVFSVDALSGRIVSMKIRKV